MVAVCINRGVARPKKWGGQTNQGRDWMGDGGVTVTHIRRLSKTAVSAQLSLPVLSSLRPISFLPLFCPFPPLPLFPTATAGRSEIALITSPAGLGQWAEPGRKTTFEVHVFWAVRIASDESRFRACSCDTVYTLAYHLTPTHVHVPLPHRISHRICINVRNDIGQKWGGHVQCVATTLASAAC